MKKNRLLVVLLAAAVSLSVFSACGKSEHSTSEQINSSVQTESEVHTETAEQPDIYRFEDYECDEVFDIQKIALNEQLEQKCVSYKFTYLSDGYKIKAYIAIPKSAIESQTPQKCIMYNRGGNSQIGQLQDDTVAIRCGMFNYTIVATQDRGAGGSEGSYQFGGDDLHDVIKLIDLCENNFSFIDMTDFCIACTSRGGVMTYPAARQDNRIKRIVAVSALSDAISGYEERDDMKEVMVNYIGCTPEENPEEYKKRSVIYWADEITIPVLIIHSKEDKKVSYKQAQQLYEKLEKHGNCTFISHDDDLHGLNPDDIPKVLEWLENT